MRCHLSNVWLTRCKAVKPASGAALRRATSSHVHVRRGFLAGRVWSRLQGAHAEVTAPLSGMAETPCSVGTPGLARWFLPPGAHLCYGPWNIRAEHWGSAVHPSSPVVCVTWGKSFCLWLAQFAPLEDGDDHDSHACGA